MKLPRNISLKASKAQIAKIRNSFEAISDYRSVQLIMDVDNQ